MSDREKHEQATNELLNASVDRDRRLIRDYETHTEITKTLLDSIRVGDLIRVNDWKRPMRVCGVSKDYFAMTMKQFDKTVYSVCEKKPREAGRHNRMERGKFHVGTDHWIFGAPIWGEFNFGGKYDFENPEAVKAYLETFELPEHAEGRSALSERSGIPIYILQIKRHAC